MHPLAVEPATVAAWVVWVLAAVAVVGVVYALVTDDREPTIVLAWLFVILLIPVLGIVAYFFIGRDFRRRTATSSDGRGPASVAEPRVEPVLESGSGFAEAATTTPRGTAGRRIEHVGRHQTAMVPLPAHDVKLYFAGADKFRDLLADLRDADRYVHLMYLIWEKDELTAEVTEILLERLRAGVEVNIIYDWLSSMPYKKDELERLAAAGARVVPCYRRLSQLNYRNHMKMAIIDGRVVYSGGMNMGQEYIDGGPRFDIWRDTHFRMSGPVLASYLSLFAATWSRNGRSEDLFTGYLAAVDDHREAGVPVQVLHSSVSTAFPTLRDVFLVALMNARRRVWVQSPYFVPDEPLITAMCVAATSGIDVRLMMTGVPDKKIPFYAAHTYFGKLLEAGVTVYRYDAGFLHAKTVTVDDDVAIIGTCNWDIRSLLLHDEVVSVFYDEPIARASGDRYEQDIKACSEVTMADLSRLSGRERLRNSVYRLLSRLL
ncbi:MAG TPA: cardiolipin synthase [Nocardioidaceae bacterium]